MFRFKMFVNSKHNDYNQGLPQIIQSVKIALDDVIVLMPIAFNSLKKLIIKKPVSHAHTSAVVKPKQQALFSINIYHAE